MFLLVHISNMNLKFLYIFQTMCWHTPMVPHSIKFIFKIITWCKSGVRNSRSADWYWSMACCEPGRTNNLRVHEASFVHITRSRLHTWNHPSRRCHQHRWSVEQERLGTAALNHIFFSLLHLYITIKNFVYFILYFFTCSSV